ncbi:MAG: sugar ABC transporter substrate-binding protein [Thermotoga sp.]|nr:sugar ABC transporter substrate-binding protein [Thermotogota bacterium]RKX54961.1 MAG: sugar ABC transporter substrate-binding protein [Thermotoga sp.]
MRKFSSVMILLLTVVLLSSMVFATTTITFWTMSLKPKFTNYITSLVNGYEKLHPDVKVIWEDIPWNVEQQKLLGAIASGKVPDVVNLNADWTLDFARRGALLPLNNLLPQDVLSDYFLTMLKATSIDGKYYSLPWYVAPDVTFYNKKIFDKAGLDPNQPPKTWDEAIIDSIIIKEKTGIYGMMPTILQSSTPPSFFGDYPLLSKDGKRAIFNGPEYVHVLTKWAALYKLGYLPKEVLGKGAWTKSTELYGSGQLAMLITGPQFADRVKWNSPDIYKVSDVAPVPLGPSKTFGAAIQDLVIVKGSKYPEVAANFAAYVTNAENEIAFDKMVTIFPTRASALKDPFFSKLDGTLPTKIRVTAAKELSHVTYVIYRIPNPHELFQALNDAVSAAFLGVKTPQKALDDAAAVWNKALSGK